MSYQSDSGDDSDVPIELLLARIDAQERQRAMMDECLNDSLNATDKAAIRSQDANEALFFSEKHTDLEITCQDINFKVHKCIVLPRSVYLQKAFDDTVTEDGKVVTINIDDEAPATVKFWLFFLYTGGINFGRFCLEEDEMAAICRDLVVFSRKVNMESLKEATLEHMFEIAD